MGTYSEQYQYDAVGNFLNFIHKGANPSNPGWTRAYTYNEASLLEAGKLSNRLSSTAVSGSQPLNKNPMPMIFTATWPACRSCRSCSGTSKTS